jgi:hypothetical protein
MGAAASGGRWVSGAARGDVNAWARREELAAGGCPVLAAVVGALEAELRAQLAAQGCGDREGEGGEADEGRARQAGAAPSPGRARRRRRRRRRRCSSSKPQRRPRSR